MMYTTPVVSLGERLKVGIHYRKYEDVEKDCDVRHVFRDSFNTWMGRVVTCVFFSGGLRICKLSSCNLHIVRSSHSRSE